MSLNLDAKSIAIGGAAVFAATQLFGGSKKTSSKSLNGLAGTKRKKSSTGTKRKASTKKAGTTKRKTAKRK